MKKGQGLSMDVIIIAIIAIIILVVLALIFTGGIGKVNQRLKDIFGIGVEGQTEDLAIQQCGVACSTAQASNKPENSAYCGKVYKIDSNNDDKIDSGEVRTCRELYPCSGVSDLNDCVSKAESKKDSVIKGLS